MSKQRAEADRLPISQRIDQRMPNPGRRTMNPTNWAIQGELFLNCSCTVFCPCVVSLGAHPPTEGHCHAWMAIAIDDGHFEGESLAGLNVGLLVDIPAAWARATGRSRPTSTKMRPAKPTTVCCKSVWRGWRHHGSVHHARVRDHRRERAPVEIVRDGKKRSINIGRKIQGEIEMIDGKSPDHPVMVSNSKYWMGPDIIAATGLRSKVRDYGRVWDFGGKSAEICPINWGGPKPL